MNIYKKIELLNNFTEAEQTFIQFLNDHPQDVIDLNINQLAKISYVSVSTIYRVFDKLDLSGFNDLKMKISSAMKSKDDNITYVNYNFPFEKNDTHYQVMSKMFTLHKQTLQSTIDLIDLDVFHKIIHVLYNASRIVLFPSFGNYIFAETFQQNMLEIGVRVEVCKEKFYQHWYSNACQKGDVAIIMTYSNRTQYFKEIVKILKKKNITIILLSSTKENEISKYVNYHLYCSSYENQKNKISSFSSKVSLQFLLDCIYSCYFQINYDKNIELKLKNDIDY